MIKTFCDKCGEEISSQKQNIYLKTSNQDTYNGTQFKGVLCNKCEQKLRRTVKVLAYRYGLYKY